MFFQFTNVDSSLVRDKNNYFYQKFHSLHPQSDSSNNKEEMSAKGSATASNDSFITPVSSVGDLITMSPRSMNTQSDSEHPTDVTDNFLTGADINSFRNVTMLEVPIYDDNIFMHASSLDYLVKCGESNRNNNFIDRRRDSLFFKFDPLYSRNEQGNFDSGHPEPASDTTECDTGYETGSTMSFSIDNHVTTPKHSLSTESLPTNFGKDKPTQKVPLVINETPKSNSIAMQSTPVLVHSVSAILTPTLVATDRLITIAGSTPAIAALRSPRQNYHNAQELDHLQSPRIILQQQDQQVFSLRQENEELKSSLHDMKHKYSRTIDDLESQVKKLTDEKQSFLEKENKLIQQLNSKILNNKQMCVVLEEYEKTISNLIKNQHQEKNVFNEMQEKLMQERDQALNHLASMESSFNDLLAKYEKCKTVIVEFKEKEKVFQHKISEYKFSIKKYEDLYNKLKQITSERLAKSNENLHNMKKNHNVEVMKLNATIKKHEITISSLQESLTQKTRDNDELTGICDELINGVC